MAYEVREFAGAAAVATLGSGINSGATSFTISDATNWPSGGTGNFFVVMDPGTASEEKIRCSNRTTTTITVAGGGRGADGTSAASHNTGATVMVCVTALDLAEANGHITGTGLDHHTQYLNTTRHDVTARHAFGAALGSPAAAANVGTSASAGAGSVPARSDHVHKIGTGAINDINMIDAGVQAALVPASMPKGYIGQGDASGQTVSSTSVTDVTGAAVTFTALANRKYLIVGEIHRSVPDTGSYELRIRTGSTTLANSSNLGTASGGANLTQMTFTVVSPSAGSITYKLSVSNATANSSAITARTAAIIVMDIGGA